MRDRHERGWDVSQGLRWAATALLACAIGPQVAAAQTVNPNVIEFRPPANHAEVSRYDLAFYTLDSSAAYLTVNVGKPTVQGDGMIRVDLTNTVSGWPMPNVVSTARVFSVAPTGAEPSTYSNSFLYQCSFTLSATSQSIGAAGGSGTVSVSAPAACAWKSSSSVSWITIASGASGTGSGTVSYTVAANTATSGRTASLTIAGVTYTVSQAAATAEAPKAPAPSPTPTEPTPSNTPPTVSITRPSPGSVTNGRQVKIDASASDADGSIASVVFYVNDAKVGSATKSPYSIQWEPPAAGTYAFKALATDNKGLSAWSAVVTATTR